MNKKTRDSRLELRRYMRAVKRNNPGANCSLHYDKLYVDNKVFVYNDMQGKVIEQVQEDHQQLPNGMFVPPSPRPPSSMTETGSISPMSTFRDFKTLNRTQSLFSMGEEDVDSVVREKEETILKLKSIIKKMEVDMERMKDQLEQQNNINGGNSVENTSDQE